MREELLKWMKDDEEKLDKSITFMVHFEKGLEILRGQFLQQQKQQ